ncbi:MAG: TolC family protein [Pseudomonadota bacterium]
MRILRFTWSALTALALAAATAAGALAEDRSEPGNRILLQLVAEARANNPDIQAAQRDWDAARQRVAPAGALDDPMLEAGVVSLPTTGRFNQEPMTMKMIGLGQRFPYPGKLRLRQDVATSEADAVGNLYQETVNRVVRDVKVAYYDLSLVDESIRLVEKNKRILEQFLSIAEARYAVGESSQADVLKAQTQLSRMVDELIKLGRERPVIEAELNRALGRVTNPKTVTTGAPRAVQQSALDLDTLREAAVRSRPKLLAQQNIITRSAKAIGLANKDYYPDFDVRFSYGQRDRLADGMPQDDMIGVTVGINLPIWRENKLGPRVAEAEAMREQATRMYDAQVNEINAMLRQQVATSEQSLKSARLYESAILPQARLAVEAALAAYQVNRVDFFTLLDNQMTVFSYEIAYVSNLTGHNKALADIEFLVGGSLPQAGIPEGGL